MKNDDTLPIVMSFLLVYLAILGILVGVAQVIATVDSDFFAQNWPTGGRIVGTVILLPWLLLGFSIWFGTVAKWLRLLVFSCFRVKTFAVLSLSFLGLFTALFLSHLFWRRFQAEQIFLNVLFLNLLFMFFLGLVLTGRFQIQQTSALLIRKKTDGRIYLYENGAIRHIPDPATLVFLGHSFGDVVIVSDKEFGAYTTRAAIDSITTAKIVRAVDDETGRIWMIFGDTRRHIPDPPTLNALQQLAERPIEEVTPEQLRTWKEGAPLISLLDR